MKRLIAIPGITVVLLAFTLEIGPAAEHPMDPLTADEIIGAASILLAGGGAQPGAIFQAVDLREPAKDVVLGVHPGDGARRATVFFRQNKKSFKSIVNPTNGSLEHGSFELKHNFFDRNPALDLRRAPFEVVP